MGGLKENDDCRLALFSRRGSLDSHNSILQDSGAQSNNAFRHRSFQFGIGHRTIACPPLLGRRAREIMDQQDAGRAASEVEGCKSRIRGLRHGGVQMDARIDASDEKSYAQTSDQNQQKAREDRLAQGH